MVQMMFKLSMIPFIPWSVYLVADKKKYWEKQGLSVDVTIYPGEQGYIEDMTEKRSDLYPLPLSSVLEMYSQNSPFYCTGFFDQANGHKNIIVKQKNVSNLKNTTILVYADEIATRYFLARYLSTRGLTLKDVNLVFPDSKSLPDLYSDPDVSACLVFETETDSVLGLADSRVAYTTKDYTEPFTLAVPAEKFTRTLEENLKGIVKGRMLAVDWINQPENREEFCSLVNQFMFNGSLKYTEDEIFTLYNQLTHQPLSALKKLNVDKTQQIFSDLTQNCLKNGIITADTARNFRPGNILKHQFLIDEWS